jgi:hypothetical protein
MLDLIEHVLGSSERAIVLVCLARHELLDIRPAWEKLAGSGRVPRAALGDDAARVAENLLGNAELDPRSTLASWRQPRAIRSSSSRCSR